MVETISEDEIEMYRECVLSELRSVDARGYELSLLTDSIIRNAIRNQRDPEDVAWAIIQ